MAVTSRPVDLRPLFVLASIACSGPRAVSEPPPPTSTSQSPLTRTGIEGCNCAGAAPAMTAPDGAPYVFQSIVSYYYQSLQAFWTKVGDDDVLKTWLPRSIEATNEEFYAWQAKSVQIYRDRDLLGFAHRYYRGIFGFLSGDGAQPNACTPALDQPTRTTGMLAHVGLSQAGICGHNDDGTLKFWQVNRIVLLMIGDVLDAYALVDAGIAQAVQIAPAAQCILPLPGPQPVIIGPGGVPMVPCRVAYRDDAVTEGVVLPVPTGAMVDGVPLVHRAFTAAGTVAMPNGLDQVRKILRDGQLRAMYAIGRPQFVAEPAAGPTQVRLVGHAIGPAAQPNPVLLPEEKAWVDATVGGYQDRCCHVECDGAPARMASFEVSRPVFGGDTYGEPAPFPGPTPLPVPIDAGVDAWVDAPRLDAGGADAPVVGMDGGMSFPDSGVMIDAGGGSGTPPGGGSGTPPGGGSGTPPGGGSGTPPGGGSGTPPGGGSGTPPGGGSGTPPGPVDAGTPPPPPHDGGSGPGCRTVCIAEGACSTANAAAGLVVMVSAVTTAECNGNCPEPAADAPAEAPTCEP